MAESYTRKELESLTAAASDPWKFLAAICVPTARGNRRFGEAMAEFQRERFALLIPPLLAVARGEQPSHSHAWIEATKGASKDSDLALLLLWLLLVTPRPLRCQIGAADEEQADEMRLIIRRVLKINERFNAFVASRLEVRADKILNPQTESTADILTSDSKSSHGSRPDVLILNELSHVTDQDFASTLLDNADKVPTSFSIVATNAGWLGTWQADWRENAIASPRWLTHIYSQPSPWIGEGQLEESRKRSLKRYARLWQGVWAPEGEGDALAESDLAAALTLTGPLAGPERGWSYVLGGDLGTAHDATALCVVGRHVGYIDEQPIDPAPPAQMPLLVRLGLAEVSESVLTNSPQVRSTVISGTGQLKLAALRIFRPGGAGGRVDLTAVEREIVALHQVFRFEAAPIDAWQAELMVNQLRRAGVPAELQHVTSPLHRAMAECVLSAFAERRLSLWNDPALIRDLQSLRIVESGAGNVRLEAPRTNRGEGTGHADTATALGLALVAARRCAAWGQAARAADRPLVCWP